METNKQIKSICDAMSLLVILREASATASYTESMEQVDKHIEAMKQAGIDNNIIDHFGIIAESAIIYRRK